MADEKQEEQRKELFKLADTFSKEVVKNFGQIVKAVVTWGSITRKEHVFTEKSDIDCVIIVDDTGIKLTDEIRDKTDATIREIARKISPKISVQPVWLLTDFWDMIKNKSPLAYSVLREGWALYDTGFFVPLRKMYELGKFPATTEAAYLRMDVVPKRLKRATSAKAMIVFEDVFYAMIESSQALIMFVGKEPPGVRGSPDAIRKYFIATGLLEERYAKDLESIVKFHKAVEYGDIKTITGKELDDWIQKAEKYVSRMEKLLKFLENKKKLEEINYMSELMIKASVVALKSIDRLPKNPKNIPEAMKKHLLDTGLVKPTYDGLLEKVLEMNSLAKKDKLDSISEQDIYTSREYVRRFLIDVKSIITEKHLKGKKQ